MIGPIAAWVAHHPEEVEKIIGIASEEDTIHTRAMAENYPCLWKTAFIERVIVYILLRSPQFRVTNNHSKGTGRTFVKVCKSRSRTNWREYCITCDQHSRLGCELEAE